ncbi:MAG: cytochrome C biogenesis protein, partial [Bacteroidetes bacterium]|nr:cytochrome C biogenesis protein [Bacteroidota bacterium]
MQSITFVGENLILGNLGHFFVVVAFISALLSAVFYTKSSANRSLGRAFFVTHTLSVLGVFTTLFVIIQGHYYEYAYAYEHSSNSLPLRYMVSCFWEGQEGSFLLWMVWNAL